MDMKKILEAMDGSKAKAEVNSSDMKTFLTIVEGKGPLNRPTTAEALTMQHYTEPKKTITNPVLNVQEGATPSMIGKYFKAVEQELAEAADRSKDRARQLAERVTTKVNELSPDTLASYKKKAGADASNSDKEGNTKRADKRFSGIVKATKKEFDNDAKGIKEDLEELFELRNQVEEAIKQRLDPKCWKGKHKEGTKIKGGVRVNNCVPNEGLEDPKDNPCWKGYKPVGTKKKSGRAVPNCVPTSEAVNAAQQAAIAIAKKKAGKK